MGAPDLSTTTKNRELIKRLRRLGWEGPTPGTGDLPRFMTRVAGDTARVVRIPSPQSYGGDIPAGLLPHILMQAGVSRKDWLRAARGDAEGT